MSQPGGESRQKRYQGEFLLKDILAQTVDLIKQ